MNETDRRPWGLIAVLDWALLSGPVPIALWVGAIGAAMWLGSRAMHAASPSMDRGRGDRILPADRGNGHSDRRLLPAVR